MSICANVDDKVSWLPASASKLSNANDMINLNEIPTKESHAPLSGVSVSSPKIHIVDIDGDIIESLNIMSHAEKLRDAINSDPESIVHHYQVMIRDER